MTVPVIGVDFDNTLVSYDDLMHEVARDQGFISPELSGGKHAIRERIRQSAAGERGWQKVQSLVYGPKIDRATLIDGVQMFFIRCRQGGISVRIISHKTEFAAGDEGKTNLRAAALTWMERRGFFREEGLGLSAQDVFFESTRDEKIERIRQLGCTHFIDDLEETFLEPSFPPHVEKLLYAPWGPARTPSGVRRFSSWQAIHDYFFPSSR